MNSTQWYRDVSLFEYDTKWFWVSVGICLALIIFLIWSDWKQKKNELTN